MRITSVMLWWMQVKALTFELRLFCQTEFCCVITRAERCCSSCTLSALRPSVLRCLDSEVRFSLLSFNVFCTEEGRPLQMFSKLPKTFPKQNRSIFSHISTDSKKIVLSENWVSTSTEPYSLSCVREQNWVVCVQMALFECPSLAERRKPILFTQWST